MTIEERVETLIPRVMRIAGVSGGVGMSELLRTALLEVARDQRETDALICERRKEQHQDSALAATSKRGQVNFYLQGHEAAECVTAIRNAEIK